MIKKCFTIFCTLAVLFVPSVFADDETPQYLDTGYIEFSVDLKIDSINYEEDFAFEIMVYNRSEYKFRISDIHDECVHIEYHDLVPKDENDDLYLEAGESVALEVTGRTGNEFEWYSKDGEYYIDFQPEVYVHVYAEDKTYFKKYDEIIPLKLDNVFDGSEIINVEWADERTRRAYFDPWEEDRDYDGINEIYYSTNHFFGVKLENLSDKVISYKRYFDIQPYETKTFHYDSYNEEQKRVFISNDFFEYKRIFEADGVYYAVELYREYDAQIIEPPVFNMEIELIDNANTEEVEYKFSLYNPSSESIEEFCFYMGNEFALGEVLGNMELFTFLPYETWNLERSFEISEIDLNHLSAGYYIDGMYYHWEIAVDDMGCEHCSFVPVEYKKSFACVEDIEKICTDEELVINLTVTPIKEEIITPSPSAKDLFKEKILEKVDEIETARRRALIVIGVLICGAVAVIVLSMKKVVKDRQNEESDD